jgi:hypothetical protein
VPPLPTFPGVDAPAPETRQVLRTLTAALDDSLPAKVLDKNLLIATWNIRHFARVTRKWQTAPGDTPKRNLQDLWCIAEIVSRFDVVALVEVKRNLEALRLLMQILGPDWGFLVSDPIEGKPGNDERLGFVFDLRRLQPSGMVGELVIPDADLKTPESVMQQQWARTPYTASFRSGDKAFTLVTLHILWGKSASDRTPELRGAAKWLYQRAEEPDEFNRNLIALGDFNIDRLDDPNWRAFIVEYGLSPPAKLLDVPRTVGQTAGKNSFYDLIAWFTKGNRSALTLRYNDAGGFIWSDHLLQEESRTEKVSRISDHYPVWAEFLLRDDG